jgi:N-acetylglucosaminyl-diphospho-decaprenol L-rhamnosyltransferase
VLAILIINYRTAQACITCLDAVLAQIDGDTRVLLLENGSGDGEKNTLIKYAALHADQIDIEISASNLGFAGGMNLLVELALRDARIDSVLLLNSDTRPIAGFLPAMQRLLNPATRCEMIAAHLLRPDDDTIDSLGITLYRSTLASNRRREDEILLGPTGGCALLSRRLLEDLRTAHGEYFDTDFFCYAEDTDLVIRARWLGYQPAYAADAMVYHSGSLSSGGAGSDFVLYHGIRNSLWWLIKNAPSGWLLRSLPWFVALHAAICLRHLRRGRIRVLWRLYRDAWRGVPAMRKKRALIGATRRVPASDFSRWVEPRFYERDYVRRAWSELWRKPR